MAKLHVHLNPKFLLPIRYIQLLFSILVLILLCYAGSNRGWWTNITAGLVLGIASSALALLATGYGIYTLHKSSTNLFDGESMGKAVLVVTPDVLLLLMWAGTAALMIKPKGKNWRKPYDYPPYFSWVAGIVLSIVEW